MRFSRHASIVLLVNSLSGWAADDLPPPTGDQIVAPEARLERLYSRPGVDQTGLTERPAAAPDGSIYFSDVAMGAGKGRIMRFDPRTKETTVFAEDSHKSNGLEFDAQGRLIACEGADRGGRAIVRWDLATKTRTVLVDRYLGKHFNAPNDLCLDRQGRVYFSDPRYVGDEPVELEHRAVYRVDVAETIVEVTHDVKMPNGVGLSPDQRTLYLADHNPGGPMKVYAFSLGPDGLVNGPRRTVVDFGAEAGCDGMTLDRQGRLYLAVRSARRPGVLVVDPSSGAEVAFIPTGVARQTGRPSGGLPTNVAFGVGPETNMLYVTVDRSLFRIPLKVEGSAAGQ